MMMMKLGKHRAATAAVRCITTTDVILTLSTNLITYLVLEIIKVCKETSRLGFLVVTYDEGSGNS